MCHREYIVWFIGIGKICFCFPMVMPIPFRDGCTKIFMAAVWDENRITEISISSTKFLIFIFIECSQTVYGIS